MPINYSIPKSRQEDKASGFTRKSRSVDPFRLTLSRFLSFISTRDISTTLSRRIDNARRVRYDRISGRSHVGIPYVPSPVLFQRLSFGSGLSANFDYICQQPVLPSLYAFSSRHNSNIDMYYQHLILGRCLTKPASPCVTAPFCSFRFSHHYPSSHQIYHSRGLSRHSHSPLRRFCPPVFAKTHGNVFSECSGRRREI